MARACLLAVLTAVAGCVAIADAVEDAACEDDYDVCVDACDERHPHDPAHETCVLECEEIYDDCIYDGC